MKFAIAILIGLVLAGCKPWTHYKYKITLDDDQTYIIVDEPVLGVYVNNSFVSDGISFNVLDEHGNYHVLTTTRRIKTKEYLGEYP